MFLLAFVFAAAWFVTGAMAAHLPGLLERAGATPLEVVAAAALVAPAQVAARLVEFFVLHRAHPLMSARIAAALHPIGVGIFAITGVAGATAFVILYGAGNGRSRSHAAPSHSLYGERTGLLGASARAAQAFAPLLFGLLLPDQGESSSSGFRRVSSAKSNVPSAPAAPNTPRSRKTAAIPCDPSHQPITVGAIMPAIFAQALQIPMPIARNRVG
jgi:hypothetical protein